MDMQMVTVVAWRGLFSDAIDSMRPVDRPRHCSTKKVSQEDDVVAVPGSQRGSQSGLHKRERRNGTRCWQKYTL
jgi:hypothetical protein